MRLRTLLLITFLPLSLSVSAQHSPNTTNYQQYTDQVIDTYIQLNWFSGSVSITKNNKTIFEKAVGYSNHQQSRHNEISSKYNLGSIAKNFTKVLIAQQILEGKLALDDKLSKFNLGLPSAIASKVTIEHLLDHKAGFSNSFTAAYRENPLNFTTVSQKLSILRDEPLRFEPGTKRLYSNYGYIILGAVLEKITGLKYPKLLEERIFSPLKMKNTTFLPTYDQPLQTERFSYQFDKTQKPVGMSEYPGPDGGIESTVQDLKRFYYALFFTNTIIARDNDTYRAVFKLNNDKWAAYGGGVGISSAVEVDLKGGFIVIVLSNSDNLIAELISQRLKSFIESGDKTQIRAMPTVFAYEFYKSHGKVKYFADFQSAYKETGYSGFIGRVINELGMALVDRKSWKEAIDQFEYLIELFPQAPQAYDSLAYAYYKQGKLELAQRTFEKATKLKPNFNSDYLANNYNN